MRFGDPIIARGSADHLMMTDEFYSNCSERNVEKLIVLSEIQVTCELT